jgi:hypothetical protein
LKIQKLFDELEAKSNMEGTQKIFGDSKMQNDYDKLDYGFFPLGSGILSGKSKIEDAEIDERGIMVLGNDFGTVSYVQNKCEGGKENNKRSATLRNILSIGLNTDRTFFTNFYLGLKDDKNNKEATEQVTMLSQKKITNDYQIFCYEFFLIQLELINPRLVLCLGKDVERTLHEKFIDIALFTKYKFEFIPHPSSAHFNWKEPIKTKIKAIVEENQRHERIFGSMKGMLTIMPDFDEPLEDFKDYM